MFGKLLAAGLLALRLSNPTGIYASGDTVRIYAVEEGGETLVHERVYNGTQNVRFSYEDLEVGFVVAPEGYSAAVTCPRDFDRFWKKELRQMRKMPLEPVLTEVPSTMEGVRCWSIEIPCVGERPVRGYMAMPAEAPKKSLPVVIFAHAAGVSGSWCRATIYETVAMSRWGSGAIVVNINAFGMLNDQPESYYKALEEGELKNYSIRPSDDREGYFFKNMFLRMVRALDFACSLKEWDGKRVMAYGQSQGGKQAFALAGLDKRVTAVVGILPAGSALTGTIPDEDIVGWPAVYYAYDDKELAKKVLPYFDCVNFIARTKAELHVEIGLIDRACPPSSIWAALNGNKKSKKHIVTCPARPHGDPQRGWEEYWHENVETDRKAFVEEYLK